MTSFSSATAVPIRSAHVPTGWSSKKNDTCCRETWSTWGNYTKGSQLKEESMLTICNKFWRTCWCWEMWHVWFKQKFIHKKSKCITKWVRTSQAYGLLTMRSLENIFWKGKTVTANVAGQLRWFLVVQQKTTLKHRQNNNKESMYTSSLSGCLSKKVQTETWTASYPINKWT